MCDGDEVFGSRQNEHVRRVVVPGYSLGRLAADAWNAQAPPESERTIAVPRAVNQTQLRLKTIAASRQGDRHGEVSGAGVEIRGELLADAMKRAAAFGQGHRLTRCRRTTCHSVLFDERRRTSAQVGHCREPPP